MDNGISREFYPQGELKSEWAMDVPKKEETARELGRAAIFSPENVSPEALEAAVDRATNERKTFDEIPAFNEMINQPEMPQFGNIETIDDGEKRRQINLDETRFSSYTKEFANADGKIVRAEVRNLEENPCAGYAALQRDRMAYLKSKFNRELK